MNKLFHRSKTPPKRYEIKATLMDQVRSDRKVCFQSIILFDFVFCGGDDDGSNDRIMAIVVRKAFRNVYNLHL